ncbi:MAG: hypothetical protein CSA50_05950 [Gammaproteobacteria bacterium]|nr:MAG: hypothetical protein CSA50_05950 [Gammaproteobacteria bacterium]
MKGFAFKIITILVGAVGLATLLFGCSILPSFGPRSTAILDAADIEQVQPTEEPHFRLIDISQTTLPTNPSQGSEYFSANYIEQELLRNNHVVIPGDVIVIRLWEAANDGLFANHGQRETSFTLRVSNNGTIDVPYAGTVTIEDKSPQQIRKILLERYQGRAIDPEISVSVKETNSLGVSVLGAVATPGHVVIPSQGIRLIDIIALAGGVPHPIWESSITLTRDGRAETLMLDQIMNHPDNNVIVIPGDTIWVKRVPRKFAVYGAITHPGKISIDQPAPTLSDLLAKSGGLNDMQAEASSVFVFRPPAQLAEKATDKAIAYRLNFARPDALVLASQFKVEASDIVYVATADASEFRKLVTMLFSPFFGSLGNVQNLGN